MIKQFEPMYAIIRMYWNGGNWKQRRISKYPVTLKKAQEHCNDPETSSKTCTNYVGKARTKRLGAWFDCYDDYNPYR